MSDEQFDQFLTKAAQEYRQPPATPKDEISLERQYDVSIAQLVERVDGAIVLGHMKVEFLYYLAWSVLNRTGQEIRDFDSFMDVISDLDFGSDEVDADADPTRSGVSPD